MTPKKAIRKREARVTQNLKKTLARLRPKLKPFLANPKPITVEQLRAGDILFFRPKSDSAIIRKCLAYGHPFSHMALYIGNGKMFNLAKTARLPLAETVLATYGAPFVLRPEITKRQTEKIAEKAKEAVGEKHNKKVEKMVQLSELTNIGFKKARTKGFNCTNVISFIFSEAGMDVTPGVHPLRAGPSHFLRNKRLRRIN